MEPPYISISGLIGVGKTTLAKVLGEKMSIPVFYEPVIDNEYLADFYADQKRYAYPLQIYLLNKRFRQQQEIIWGNKGAIQDRTIYEDTIFARMLKDDDLINPRDFETYLSLSSCLFNFMKKPDFIIHLDISPKTSMERIRTRNRDCEKNVSVTYLERLHMYYKSWIIEISKKIPVLIINYETYKPVDEVVETIEHWYKNESHMYIV